MDAPRPDPRLPDPADPPEGPAPPPRPRMGWRTIDGAGRRVVVLDLPPDDAERVRWRLGLE